jgi:hypothetical protein
MIYAYKFLNICKNICFQYFRRIYLFCVLNGIIKVKLKENWYNIDKCNLLKNVINFKNLYDNLKNIYKKNRKKLYNIYTNQKKL